MEFSQFSSPFSALFLWLYLIHLHIFQMNFQLHVMCVIFAKEISLLVKSCTENILLILALIKKNSLVFWCTIGNLKDCVCLRLYSQKVSSRRAAISAMLDPKGRAFVLIQVLYFRIISSFFKVSKVSKVCDF